MKHNTRASMGSDDDNDDYSELFFHLLSALFCVTNIL